MYFAKQPPGGRHLAPRRVQSRSAWMLAPGGLALASLVLFVAALVANLGPARVSDDTGQPAPDTRPAQAAPAVQQGGDNQAAAPAQAAQPPADQQQPAAAQLVAVAKLEGKKLGDIATYSDGIMACVFRTSHQDVGGGLAEVHITIKMKNAGRQPVDASTASVELAFARQSSRATQVAEKRMGTLQPGAEGVGEWTFRMPADRIRDISVTIAPSDSHQPVTFNGASR